MRDDAAMRRRWAIASAIVALVYGSVAVMYLLFAFDASNRNGAMVTVSAAGVFLAVPALLFGFVAWKWTRPVSGSIDGVQDH